MTAVTCEQVVRDTASGGSETGGSVRNSENMFEDENENEGGRMRPAPSAPPV